MYRESQFDKEVYRTGEVMEVLGVGYETIKTYDRNGTLPFKKVNNRRILFREDLLDYLDSKGMLLRDGAKERRDVVYARVSSHEQKAKGDLDRQAMFLVEHADRLKNPLVLKEVGSGLNDRRPKLHELIGLVMDDEVDRVFVTYRDRLTRFGFRYLEDVFSHKGTQIVVLDDKEGRKSAEQELVEDMMGLVASFSGKLYGIRSAKGRKRRSGK